MSFQRLTELRSLMSSQSSSLAAYIVPTRDAHNSDYISPADARREWISGFTGSDGTAVVTTNKALVWTDEIYYTEFEKEVDVKIWTLMKQTLPETLSIEKWLTSNLKPGSVVGVDPYTITKEEWTPLQAALSKANMQLIAVEKNLVDQVRYKLNDPPPKRPQNDIMHLPLQYTGKSAGQKIKELRKKMAEKKASALVITALDEVAYTLNLRGSDIKYNPVFFSYLLITSNSVTLFWQEGRIPENIHKYVSEEGVKIEGKPYSKITEVLRNLSQDLSNNGEGEHSIWISNTASEAIHRAVSGEGILTKPITLISEVSPVALAKLIKNDVELEGFRRCHVRDGIAVVRFYKWLHDQIDAGNAITEIQATERLLEFRKEEKDFMSHSFEPIPSAGENSAIIHYIPLASSPRVIRADDVFLLDSGGQYRDGTTDITRTRHMGDPTDCQKDAFTRVLKGQIGVGTALFPVGVKGNVLDILSRKYLWDVGLDFPHGTGHGVGHFLIVKEGPTGISREHYPQNPGLESGQILSIEPGYYKMGEFGIRHEELVETILITKDSKHPRASNLLGNYEDRGVLGFNILSLCPHQTKFMKIELLDKFELNFINSYHQRVLSTLGPILKERGLQEDFKWLEKECASISCLGQHTVFGYVPSSRYGDLKTQRYVKTEVRKLSPSLSLQRVAAVRDVMRQHGIDALIVPTADPHNNPDTSLMDARREWLTGLSGTIGTALVTANRTFLWTDAMYFAQFEIQVDTNVWTLMRMGIEPTIEESTKMPFGSVVGIDPTTYTHTEWSALEYELHFADIRLEPLYSNIVDEARRNIDDPPPPRPNRPLFDLSANFTGKISRDKISELVYQIRAKSASALILTSLDDIAYILNIRGSDIPYNPFFLSYLIIQADSV